MPARLKPIPAGLVAQLLRWQPRGDGTDYRPDVVPELRAPQWRWRITQRTDEYRLVPGLDWNTFVELLTTLGAAAVLAVVLFLFSPLAGIILLGVSVLVFGGCLILWGVEHRKRCAAGPALTISGDLIKIPSQPDLPAHDVQAIECVSFIFATGKGIFSSDHARRTHLVLRLRDADPRYLIITRHGGNLETCGPQLADHLGVAYRWTHLGVLRQDDQPA